MTSSAYSVLLALLISCATTSALADGDKGHLEITPTGSLRYPRFENETLRAVRSLAEWKALWHPYNPGSESTSPDVDFTKYTLLIAALGTRGSGGYTVTIRNAVEDGPMVHVSVLELRPHGPGCAATTEISYPTTAVLIPRTAKTIWFEVKSADLDCTSFRNRVGG
jgi:hypothetical protein